MATENENGNPNEEPDNEALAQKLYNRFFMAAGGVAGFGATSSATLLVNGNGGAGVAALAATFALAIGGAYVLKAKKQNDYPETTPSLNISRYIAGCVLGVAANLAVIGLPDFEQDQPNPDSEQSVLELLDHVRPATLPHPA